MQPYFYLAKVYDEIMPERWYREWYVFLLTLIKKLAFKPEFIIDAACGTGRLTKYLLILGKVVGVDKSEAMLAVARRRCPTVKFIRSDIRLFHLPRKKKADMLICAFDSLNYLSTLKQFRRTMQNFAANIKPGGYIFFDLNGESVFSQECQVKAKNVRIFKLKQIEVVWRNFRSRRRWKVVIEMKFRNRPNAIFRELHTEYYFNPAAVKQILTQSGFSLVAIYAGIGFKQVKRSNARYFFIARRRQNDP